MKPREFYFEYMSESAEYQQLSTKPPYVRDNSFELVHVIDYEAYQKALAAISDLMNQADNAVSRYKDTGHDITDYSPLSVALFNLKNSLDESRKVVTDLGELNTPEREG